MRTLKFAPGKYTGTTVDLKSLKRKAEREKLVGKSIGYDLRGSYLMNYGTVTGLVGRSLEVNGNVRDLHEFDQIVVLHDRGVSDADLG